jgi:hypothetical protein
MRGVAAEKLAHFDFAKIASRQEALQTIFSSLLDISYHPISDLFQKNRVFQQPQDSRHLSGRKSSSRVRMNEGVISRRTHYVPSRDGQRFIVNTQNLDASSNPITVVLNWQAELKK